MQMQACAANLDELKQELGLDDSGIQALFKRLYMARPCAEKIFTAVKDSSEEAENQVDELEPGAAVTMASIEERQQF